MSSVVALIAQESNIWFTLISYSRQGRFLIAVVLERVNTWG